MSHLFTYNASQNDLDTLLEELNRLKMELGPPASLDRSNRLQNSRETNKHLNLLQEQYNKALDGIASLSPGPLSDPLDALPQEIWENIIYEAGYGIIPTLQEGIYQMVDIDYMLPLTLVSTRWREVILNHPRFWNTLRLEPGVHDLEAKLSLSIILSRDLPLSVYIDEDYGSRALWETFGHFIVSQRLWIRSLVLSDMVEPDLVFRSIGKAPLLQLLSIGSAGSPSAIELNFIQSAKLIRSITGGIYFSNDDLEILSLENIHTISITHATEETVAHLSGLESLEKVEFIDFFENHLHTGKVGFLAWKRFSCSGYIGGIIECVMRTTAMNLVELSVSVYFPDIPKLLLLCNCMSQLHSLEVVAYESPLLSTKPEKVQFQSVDPFPLPIRNLRFQTNGRFSPDENATLTTLFAKLEFMAPNVQYLSCSAPVYKPLLRYACSLQLLRSVTFPFLIRPRPRLSKPIGILKTEKLVIHDAVILELIQTTGITSITLLGYSDLWTGLRERPLSSEWERLTTISVQPTTTNWEGISLPNVTTVEFVGPLGRDSLTHGLNSLCKVIATCPQDFPALEKLTSDGVPEWDILFIMLEQRNLFISPNRRESISKIKCLNLYIQPPISILKPLTRLLGGRFTCRPSNHQLSLSCIAETLFDPTIPGCLLCHLALRPCMASKGSNLTVDFSKCKILSRYPDSLEDILATRIGRLEDWGSMLDQVEIVYADFDGVARPHQIVRECNEISQFDKIEITEHSLDGIKYESAELEVI